MNRIWITATGLAMTFALTAAPTLAADAEAAEEGDAPGLLNWQPGEYIWTLLLFLLLLGLLVKFVWPPILKGLQDREAKIRHDLDEAARANSEARQTLDQYKAQLAEARKESQQMIDQSRKEAERIANDLRDKAQRDIAQMRQRAEAEIQAAKEQAVSEIYEQTATLATEVAGRILRREISADDQRALIEESLNKLEQTESV